MAATIRDIRDRTGLSLATISKYLNGGNVLPENRKAIAKAIEELHYEVNEVARGLATRRTKTIGVLLYELQTYADTQNASVLRVGSTQSTALTDLSAVPGRSLAAALKDRHTSQHRSIGGSSTQNDVCPIL